MKTFKVRVIKFGSGYNVTIKAHSEASAIVIAMKQEGYPQAYVVCEIA